MSKKKITALYITACLLLTLAEALSLDTIDWRVIVRFVGLSIFAYMGYVLIQRMEE